MNQEKNTIKPEITPEYTLFPDVGQDGIGQVIFFDSPEECNDDDVHPADFAAEADSYEMVITDNYRNRLIAWLVSSSIIHLSDMLDLVDLCDEQDKRNDSPPDWAENRKGVRPFRLYKISIMAKKDQMSFVIDEVHLDSIAQFQNHLFELDAAIDAYQQCTEKEE